MSETFECFSFLAERGPVWVGEVEELERRIAERQKEIARLPISAMVKLKKTGSNESIRPSKQEKGRHSPRSGEKEAQSIESKHEDSTAKLGEAAPNKDGNITLSAEQAFALPSKSKPGSSASSTTGMPSKFRTKSMIVVYYDSVVQHAFDQLVRHISTGRNRIRRAKQAETMSQLTKRFQNDGDQTSSDFPLLPRVNLGATPNSKGTPVPLFRSTRAPLSPRNDRAKSGDCGSGDEEKDALSRVDAFLETAQSHCEAGAHQFLRDGKCASDTKATREAFQALATLSRSELGKLEAEAKEVERKRRERATLADMGTDSASMASGPTGLPAEVSIGSGLIEADDSGDDAEGNEEFEVPLPPLASLRATART